MSDADGWSSPALAAKTSARGDRHGDGVTGCDGGRHGPRLCVATAAAGPCIMHTAAARGPASGETRGLQGPIRGFLRQTPITQRH